MSRMKQPNSQRNSQSAGPIVLFSGAALAAAALLGGLWLGGAFGTRQAPAQTGVPGRGAPAAQAPASAAVSAAQSHTTGSSAQPAASQAGSTMSQTDRGEDETSNADANTAPARSNHGSGMTANTSAAAPASSGSTGAGSTDESAPDAPAAPALDPADRYQVTYADHEPEALTAAEEGLLGTPALVMFHADWCHVCHEVMPTVHELRDRYKGELAVVKVNVDQRDPAMAAYPVRGTPTFVLFDRHGQAMRTQRGWPGEGLMARYMDSAVAIQ